MRRGRGRTHARRGSRIAREAPAAILAAAGRGERIGSQAPKQFRLLGGRPLFEWSLDALVSAGCDPIVLVVPVEHVDRVRDVVDAERVVVAAGGRTRQDSVAGGLGAVNSTHVVIQDAARPFCTPELVKGVLTGLEHAEGCIAAVPVDETLKRVRRDAMLGGRAGAPATSAYPIVETQDRSDLWRAQTPQAFHTEVLRAAHRRAGREGFVATDDAQLLERYGGRVVVIESATTNIKVTHPRDFELAERLLELRA